MKKSGRDILITIDDIQICYDDLGEGDIPIIFIHGFPFNKSSWKPQVEVLKESYRVITYDIRGYGKSTADDTDFSMDLFADDLIRLMNALMIEKATVCGLSMGGYILLNAVSRHANRFHSLIFSDTQCVADTTEGKEKRFKTIELIESKGLAEFTEGFLKNIFCRKTLQENPDIVDFIRNMVLGASESSVKRTLKALAERKETCSILESITLPALVLCGIEDIITPPDQARKLHENIAGSKMSFLNPAGHMSNLEQSETFNMLVGDFLKARITGI